MEQRCRNYISMQINKIFISSTTQQRRLMEVTHFLKKSAFVLAHGVLQWLQRSFFLWGGGGGRRDNLVSLTQKLSKAITTSNQRKGGYIKSQEERTVKTIKLSEGQENAGDQFIKADFISTLPRLNFLACLSPSCSRQSPKKNPAPESKLVSPSFKTRESYLGFLSLVYAATFAGSAFMPVLSARSYFVHRYCLT